MKVFYHHAAGGNVGDDLNAVLWQRLLPDLQQLETAQWLVGVGTILDRRLNPLAGRKIVMGSGLRPTLQPGTGQRDLWGDAPWGDVRFAAVRGKLTAQQLGLGREVVLCDPGFLVGRVWPGYCATANGACSDRVGLIPHVYSGQWSQIAAAAADAGLDVISPTLPLETFLQRLGSCARVYCESLHAAIFADALRIPWARVRISSHYYEGKGVAEFKWRDAFSVVDTPVAPAVPAALIPLRRAWLRPAQALAERRLVKMLMQRRDDESVFRISAADRLHERVESLLSRVEQLRSAEQVERWPVMQRLVSARNASGAGTPRVLAFPKDGENAWLRKFSGMLEAGGASVDDFSFRRAWTRRYDVLHLHWPDSHLLTQSWWGALGKHARLALLLAYLRSRGTRIVWMMHNLQPHEKNHWLSARLFALWFPRMCTQVIALTAHGLACAHALYPSLRRKPAAIVPHGHYRDEYPPAPSREISRDQLGLPRERFTWVFVGNIRRYKNVPLLIEAFRQIPGDDTQLIIAGAPGHGVSAQELAQLAAGDERIHLYPAFVPDAKLPLFIGAADMVVLPFDSILNSGSVLLALSFNRTVLAPRLGALPEIHSKVGSRWLRLYDGSLTAQVLQDARSAQSGDGEHEQVDLSAFDWNAIAQHTLDLYRSHSADAAPQSFKRSAAQSEQLTVDGPS